MSQPRCCRYYGSKTYTVKCVGKKSFKIKFITTHRIHKHQEGLLIPHTVTYTVQRQHTMKRCGFSSHLRSNVQHVIPLSVLCSQACLRSQQLKQKQSASSSPQRCVWCSTFVELPPMPSLQPHSACPTASAPRVEVDPSCNSIDYHSRMRPENILHPHRSPQSPL